MRDDRALTAAIESKKPKPKPIPTIMGYVVLHLEKAAGSDTAMSAHIERTIKPKNADETRTYLNRELITFPEGVHNRTGAIQYRLDTAGLQRKISKNQVRAIRVMLSGSADQMKQLEASGQLTPWCYTNLNWLKETYGNENLVSAVLQMDESTPHIHATVVPIVTGERRKARLEQEQEKRMTGKPKKKYKKKNPNQTRLCADDVMTRDKLKVYQNSYAQAMQVYGLQRGIEGSKAKHIGTSQYYRELYVQTSNLQENIETLLGQQQDAQKNTEELKQKEQQTQNELNQKQLELKQVKSQVNVEKFKDTSAKAGASIAEGISTFFSNSKLRYLENERDQLQEKVLVLTDENKKLAVNTQTILSETNKKIETLEKERVQLFEFFPFLKEELFIAKLCRYVGFTLDMTKKLLNGETIGFSGELQSPEHKRGFKTEHSIAKIEDNPTEKERFKLAIDGTDIYQWCKLKEKQFRRSIGLEIQLPKQKNRGRRW